MIEQQPIFIYTYTRIIAACKFSLYEIYKPPAKRNMPFSPLLVIFLSNIYQQGEANSLFPFKFDKKYNLLVTIKEYKNEIIINKDTIFKGHNEYTYYKKGEISTSQLIGEHSNIYFYS